MVQSWGIDSSWRFTLLIATLFLLIDTKRCGINHKNNRICQLCNPKYRKKLYNLSLCTINSTITLRYYNLVTQWRKRFGACLSNRYGWKKKKPKHEKLSGHSWYIFLWFFYFSCTRYFFARLVERQRRFEWSPHGDSTRPTSLNFDSGNSLTGRT